MKYFNIKRYKIATIVKKINILGYNFLKFFKFLKFAYHEEENVKKFFKYFDLKKIKNKKIFKFFNYKIYNLNISAIKKINLENNKFLLLHLPAAIIFFILLYLVIPSFYNYDKDEITKKVCKNKNIQCLIKGDVNYSYFPTPRINISDLLINDISKGKNKLISAEKVSIKISFKNLLAKEKHKFKKIELNNFEINLNIKNYKNVFSIINKTPIVFLKGKIIFFDGKNYIAAINKSYLNIKYKKDSVEAKLNGRFLEDDINISYIKEKIENKGSTKIKIKLKDLNFLSEFAFFNPPTEKEKISGNFVIKKNKNKITGIFDYKNNQLTINKSNLRNAFLDGKLEGKVMLLPYFNFDLNLNMNSLNFTKLYNNFLNLNIKSQKKIFKFNNKINGKLNFTADKVYSKNNLVKSFESRIIFYNGNARIEQFLVDMGKLGAADLLGTIENEDKFTNFKFESNIFVDNKKKFLSKFGIYNKKKKPSNFFISGNFDLKNIKTSFYEISSENKIENEDVNYIEMEFNDLMLDEAFKNLFNFSKFKNFLKSIISDKN